MRPAVKLLTAIYILFLLLLSLSGSISGIVGDLIYILAFATAIFLGEKGAKHLRRMREEQSGLAETETVGFGLTLEGARSFLPLVMPTVALVFALAWLTSILLGAFGYTGNLIEDGPIWRLLLVHALVPAVIEELVFRYLPIKLLYPYSPRGCVLISSLYFALIHLDLFKMPYAFAAGLLLMTADLIAGSVLPSLFIHLINNAASVLLMKYGWREGFITAFYVTLVTLTVISIAFVILRWRKYKQEIKSICERGDMSCGHSPAMLALLCVGVAIFSLVSA